MGSVNPLAGCSILVVEDEPLIALEMAALFQSAGAEVVHARALADARAVAGERRVCAAVLDYSLGDRSVKSLCSLLFERGIPFMFYSGYDDLQQRFPHSVVVGKPASGEALVKAVAGLVSPATRLLAHLD